MIDDLVRITVSCNNNCLFCYVNKQDRNSVLRTPEQVKEAITEIRRQGKGRIRFTGGEPTLHKRLPEYIQFARKAGFREVQVQTNARLCCYKELVGDLRKAGLTSALVNFSSHDEDIFDRLTAVEGSYRQTCEGVENLLEQGIAVPMNLVITTLNFQGLTETARFLHRRFEGKFSITFSSLSIHGNASRNPWLVPKIGDVQPSLTEAMRYCLEEGIGFTIPDLCGLPPCCLQGFEEFSDWLDESQIAARQDTSELSGEMIKAPGCSKCKWNDRCLGVRKKYAELHGTEELHPVE